MTIVYQVVVVIGVIKYEPRFMRAESGFFETLGIEVRDFNGMSVQEVADALRVP